jgi:type VI secretion system ImpB/VipA family protein
MESLQHVLDRVRKPRVQITYDVEIGNAIEMKELPFVMGVMADLSGKRKEEFLKLKDRKFVALDPDSFGEIMKSIEPSVGVEVASKLPEAAEGDRLSVLLTFKSMDDFGPLAIAKQMESLSGYCDSRKKLSDLLSKLDGKDVLISVLKSVMDDPAKLAQLKKELEAASGAEA